MERTRAIIHNKITRRVGLALIAATGAIAVSASGGSQNACAADLVLARAAATAPNPNFGGVDVTGLSCPPNARGISLKETGTGFRHIVGFNPATGQDIRGSGVNIGGTGETGFVDVPADKIAEDSAVGLRAEDQQGNVLGQTQVVMNCVSDTPESTTIAPTTIAPTTSVAPTTVAPTTTKAPATTVAQPATTLSSGSQQSTTTTHGAIPGETTTTIPGASLTFVPGPDTGITFPQTIVVPTSTDRVLSRAC